MICDPLNAADDPAMPKVRTALDRRSAAEHLAPLLRASGFGGRPEVRSARVVRHKPGRRCLIEYEVAFDNAGEAQLALVAKVRAKGADERAHRVLAALWQAGFESTSSDGISVPRAVGVVPELGMTVQLKVPGDPASRLLPLPGGVPLAARLADVAHKLHGARVPTERVHDIDEELAILHTRLDIVAAAQPQLSPRIAHLLRACDALAQHLRSQSSGWDRCGVHRDYYPDQVLVDVADGGRLYLLDLDLYCAGDPAIDVGNCMAHVMEQALRSAGDPEAYAAHERALLDRYAELAGRTSRPRVVGYAALSLARHVYISTLFPERREFTTELLEISTVRVKQAITTRTSG